MRWKNVSIIGLGLLGGSLGKAMVHRQLAERVTGLVRRSEAITDAVDAGVVHQAVMEPSKAVQEADLVVLCTPVLQIPSMVEQILPHLKAGCVVTDVGSVKCELVEKLEPLIASAGATYLGSHPMAGSEQQGLGHANAQLFVGATCVVTPSESTPAKVLAEVTALWELVGGHPRVMSAQEHDQCVAYASHLPHALAAMLSWSSLNPSQGKHPPALCSSGFRDTTRVASGSPEMWADIFISNRRAIMQSLSSHQDLCAQLAQWLEAGDRESILQWLSQSKSRRDDWLVTYLNRLEQAENPEDQLALKKH